MRLSVALGGRPHLGPLLAGEVSPVGYELEPAQTGPIIAAYRRMVRELAFDVCELAPVTFLMALEAGVPLCAIPVFLDRRFHHGDLICAPNSGITAPEQLAGRRVGVRAYSVTTGVWGRGILAHEYGVDLDAVTWVVDDDDHLPTPDRPNVERISDGRSLQELLGSGCIDAAFTGNAGTGRAGAPRAGWDATRAAPAAGNEDADMAVPYPLFPDAGAVAREWYARTGIYPLHAIVTVRRELVERDPEFPTALYRAFAESKQTYLASDPRWDALPHLQTQQRLMHGDPLPFGEAANARSLDALARLGHEQGLLGDDLPPAGGWFAAGDYPSA